MSFLKKIVGAFFPSGGASSDGAMRVYVRCNACKEALMTRIDLRNDLSLADDDSYLTRKVIIGNAGCYRPIEVTLHFDSRRSITEKEITGGTFITAEEYEAEIGGAA